MVTSIGGFSSYGSFLKDTLGKTKDITWDNFLEPTVKSFLRTTATQRETSPLWNPIRGTAIGDFLDIPDEQYKRSAGLIVGAYEPGSAWNAPVDTDITKTQGNVLLNELNLDWDEEINKPIDEPIVFNISGDKAKELLTKANISPVDTLWEKYFAKQRVDSVIIFDLPPSWEKTDPISWKRNEDRIKFLIKNPDYKQDTVIPSEFESETAAKQAGSWEGKAYTHHVFTKYEDVPSTEVVGPINRAEFFQDIRRSVHDSGFASEEGLSALPATILGRIAGGVSTLGTSETYAMGVYAETKAEDIIDTITMPAELTIPGAAALSGALKPHLRQGIRQVRIATPSFRPIIKALTHADYKKLAWVFSENPTFNQNHINNESVINILNTIKQTGAEPDAAIALTNAIANKSITKYGNPEEAFENISLVAGANDSSLGIYRNDTTGKYFEIDNLLIPGGNKIYFKRGGGDELGIRSASEAIEDTPQLSAPIFKSNLEEVFELERSKGQWANKDGIPKRNLLDDILEVHDIQRYSGSQRNLDVGLRLSKPDIDMMGIRSWVEDLPDGTVVPWDELINRSRADSMHIVMHKALDLYSHPVDYPHGDFKLVSPGYNKNDEVILLGFDFTETLGNRSTFNRSNIDAIYDPLNTGQRFRTTYTHYTAVPEETISGRNIPLSGQVTDPDWRSNYDIHNDLIGHVRISERAFYDTDGSILLTTGIGEQQFDHLASINSQRINNPDIFIGLLQEKTDVFSFWRGQDRGGNYTGTFRHTNLTQESGKPDYTNTFNVVNDPQWGRFINLGNKSFQGEYQRSINVIGAGDQIGQQNLEGQFNLIINKLSELGYRQSDEILEVASRADDTPVIKEVAFAFNADEFAETALMSPSTRKTAAIANERANAATYGMNRRDILFIEDTDEFKPMAQAIGEEVQFASDAFAVPKMRTSPTDNDQVFIHVRLTDSRRNVHPTIEIIIGSNPVLDQVRPIRKQAAEFQQIIPKFSDITQRQAAYSHPSQLTWGTARDVLNFGYSLRDFRQSFKFNIFDEIFGTVTGRTVSNSGDVSYTGIALRTGKPKSTIYTRADVETGRMGIRVVENQDGTWSAIDGPRSQDILVKDRDTKDEVIDEVLRIFDSNTDRKAKIPEDSWLAKSAEGAMLRLMAQKNALENKPGLLWSPADVIKERYPAGAPYYPYKFIEDKGSMALEMSKSINGILKQNGYDLSGVSAINVGKTFISRRKVLVPETRMDGTDPFPYEILSTNSSDDTLVEALRNFNADKLPDLIKNMEDELLRLQTFYKRFPNQTTGSTSKERHLLEDALRSLKMLEDRIDRNPIKEPFGAVAQYSIYPPTSLADLIEWQGLSRFGLAHGSDESNIITALGHQAHLFDRRLQGVSIPDQEITDASSGLKIGARDLEEEGQDWNYLDLNKKIPFKLKTVNGKEIENRYETLGDILRDVPIRQHQIKPDINGKGKILGLVDFTSDGKAYVRIADAKDFPTFVHEFGHIFRRELSYEELEKVGRIIMGDAEFDALPNKNMWTVDAEEVFANAFENYIVTGRYKTGLKPTFDRFLAWIRDIYNAIRGTSIAEKMNPKLVEFLDEVVDVGRPTEAYIRANVPAQDIDNALRYFGYDTSVIRTPPIESSIKGVNLDGLADHALVQTRLFKRADDRRFAGERASINDRQKAINELPWDEFKKWEAEHFDDAVYTVPLLTSISDIDTAITVGSRLDGWERLARIQPFRSIFKAVSPTAGQKNPLLKSIYIMEKLEADGENLTVHALSNLLRLGSSEKVFGGFDSTGRIGGGLLEGFNVNDIRSNPLDSKWRNLLTVDQTRWIRAAESIERAKLAMLKAEGIDIRTLPEDEGAGIVYAGRRMFAKLSDDGTVLDTINMGTARRPGARASFEKARKFETMEEAIENGYRYLTEEEALGLNLNAAYKKVAAKRWEEYIDGNLVYTRTSGALSTLKTQRDIASRNLKNTKALLKQLQQTKRGENIHPSTLRSLKANFPKFAGSLDEISRITLEHLIDAGHKAAGQPISFTPTKAMIADIFAKMLSLESQVQALQLAGQPVPYQLSRALAKAKQSHAFKKFAFTEAYKNFKEGKGFQYTFSRSARSILMEPRDGLIDSLIDVVGGRTTPGSRRKQGGLLQTASAEAAEKQKAFADSGKEARTPHAYEGVTPDLPILRGKIFTEEQPAWANGKTGREIAADLTKEIIGNETGFESGFAQVLRASRPLNAAFKFFSLSADASVFLIHGQFIIGESLSNPRVFGGLLKGFTASLFNPEFQYKQIAENQELLAKYPKVVMSVGGGTENTDYIEMLHRAGYSRFTPLRVGSKILQAPYQPFMRSFTGALDGAGIQLLKAFDHLATSPQKIEELSDYVNEVRGLQPVKTLGVSAKQREIERQTLLASQYTRAVGSLIIDAFRPEARLPRFGRKISTDYNLRSQLARRAIARTHAAFAMLVVAGAFSQGEDLDEIVNRLTPTHPNYMSVNIRGSELGLGGKARSVTRLFGQIGYAIQNDDWESLSPKNITMDNPYFRWIRGQLAYFPGAIITGSVGSTYMGDKIYGDGMGMWDTTKAVGKHMITPLMGPMWARNSLIEAGDSIDKSLRGIAEFSGWRTHPEGSRAILNEFASDVVGISYDDMYAFERKLLRLVIADKLKPIQRERLERGDRYAEYWNALEDLDNRRIEEEWKLIDDYDNRTGKFGIEDRSRAAFMSHYYKIQEDYSRERFYLNRQYEMYQDDVEYDEDDPSKFVMSQWYELYDLADTSSGFSSEKLELLQREFYTKTLPDGTSYENFKPIINMEINNTKHPEPIQRMIKRETKFEYEQAHNLRMQVLRGRGNWDQVFDKYGITEEDLKIWLLRDTRIAIE